MKLYHFMPSKFAIENIKNRQLKVSFSDLVNDLYELRPFDFGERDEGRRLRDAWGKCVEKHSQTQGFVSFSRSWSSPTMWAHYAENHHGVCLGFEVANRRPTLLEKIKYVRKLPRFNKEAITTQLVLDNMLKIAKKTKSSHWKYEKEWRIYSSLNDQEIIDRRNGETLFFIPFDDNLILKEVILGVRSPFSSREIRDALQPTDEVEILTARPAFHSYAMVQQQNPKYQK